MKFSSALFLAYHSKNMRLGLRDKLILLQHTGSAIVNSAYKSHDQGIPLCML